MTKPVETIPTLPSSTPTFAASTYIDEALKALTLVGAYLNRHRRAVALCSTFTALVGTTAYFGLRNNKPRDPKPEPKPDDGVPKKLCFDTPAQKVTSASGKLADEISKWWNYDGECIFLVPDNHGDSVVIEIGETQLNERGFSKNLKGMIESFTQTFSDQALEIRINAHDHDKSVDNCLKHLPPALRNREDQMRDADFVSIRGGKLSGGKCAELLRISDVEFVDVKLLNGVRTLRRATLSPGTSDVTIEYTSTVGPEQTSRWKSIANAQLLEGELILRGEGITDSFVEMLCECRRDKPLRLVDTPNVSILPLVAGKLDVTLISDQQRITIDPTNSLITLEGNNIPDELIKQILSVWDMRLQLVGCATDTIVNNLLLWSGEELYLVDPSLTKAGMIDLLDAVKNGKEQWTKTNGHCGALGLSLCGWGESDDEFVAKLKEVRDGENALVWIQSNEINYQWFGDADVEEADTDLEPEPTTPYQSPSRSARRGYPDSLRKVILLRTGKKVPKAYVTSPLRKTTHVDDLNGTE